ncbi:heme-binding protein 2 [Clinocottus analis]|uniref:heme-binding protein 2 n=1 Tax=Clinocottus analis TaxID=304258 RepID=UPI0035C1182F
MCFRIYLPALVGFLFVFTAEARVGNSSELSFCTEAEQCLLFDLICKTDDYEVRHYESVNWVSTDEESWSMDFASMTTFKRLFNYIKENDIQMTAPVIIEVPTTGLWLEWSTYKMSFLLPVEHQQNPPPPSDVNVYINQMPEMKVYVRSYGGWMVGISDKIKANSLSSALNAVGAKYTKSSHYGVGYNSPMTMLNRHNEVWFVSEDEPVCDSGSDSSEEN